MNKYSMGLTLERVKPHFLFLFISLVLAALPISSVSFAQGPGNSNQSQTTSGSYSGSSPTSQGSAAAPPPSSSQKPASQGSSAIATDCDILCLYDRTADLAIYQADFRLFRLKLMSAALYKGDSVWSQLKYKKQSEGSADFEAKRYCRFLEVGVQSIGMTEDQLKNQQNTQACSLALTPVQVRRVAGDFCPSYARSGDELNACFDRFELQEVKAIKGLLDTVRVCRNAVDQLKIKTTDQRAKMKLGKGSQSGKQKGNKLPEVVRLESLKEEIKRQELAVKKLELTSGDHFQKWLNENKPKKPVREDFCIKEEVSAQDEEAPDRVVYQIKMNGSQCAIDEKSFKAAEVDYKNREQTFLKEFKDASQEATDKHQKGQKFSGYDQPIDLDNLHDDGIDQKTLELTSARWEKGIGALKGNGDAYMSLDLIEIDGVLNQYLRCATLLKNHKTCP